MRSRLGFLLLSLGVACAEGSTTLDAGKDAADAGSAGDAGPGDAMVEPDAGPPACATPEVREVSIPMRDDRSLSALVRAPSDCRLPTILIQTPYDKNATRGSWLEPTSPQPLFDSLDYAVVVVDWRGFFGSTDARVEGAQPYGQDGYDTVEWIAAQPWSNGRVGTYGVSALCVQQYRTAAQRPPHLSAAVPIFCEMNTDYLQVYPGGVLREEYVAFLGAYFGADLFRDHPYQDNLWRLSGQAIDPAAIGVPTLVVAGWYDLYPIGSFRTFDALASAGDPAVRDEHRLLIGPWVHFATGGEGGNADGIDPAYLDVDKRVQEDALAFFDLHLRGRPSEAERWSQVRYRASGEDAWESGDRWPPAVTSERPFYLAPGDRLAEVAPAVSATVAIPYDPADPSPSTGGATLLPVLAHGPQPQTRVLDRDDARAFTSAPLDAPLRLRGPITVEIALSTTGADTDLAVRLTDVSPAGEHLLIAEGIRRLKLRDAYSAPSTVTPGERYRLSIYMTSELAYTFAAGHRIGLILSGSNYPRFARNPGNGADALGMGESGTPLVNTIYLDGESRLVLATE